MKRKILPIAISLILAFSFMSCKTVSTLKEKGIPAVAGLVQALGPDLITAISEDILGLVEAPIALASGLLPEESTEEEK